MIHNLPPKVIFLPTPLVPDGDSFSLEIAGDRLELKLHHVPEMIKFHSGTGLMRLYLLS
jgi:hypothetical protein